MVRPPDGPARDWVRASISYAAYETALVAQDRFEAPTNVPELLLIETLKLHLATTPSGESGRLRALRDPVLAPALAQSTPRRNASGTSLTWPARLTSRSRCWRERFREVLGVAPIRYLTGWRMHLAKDLLRSSGLGVAAIAHRVGYDSEEAFSRGVQARNGTGAQLLAAHPLRNVAELLASQYVAGEQRHHHDCSHRHRGRSRI